AGGDICISIKEESGKLLFVIEDSGLGFTEEDIRRGTQQFYQGDKSRNSRNHYGVGLFMVDSFVKHQGGRLTLENSPRTKGALVRLEINM
uniref:ATP-binding protein n=1 Tax=Muricomes intestini TaxID=1796634 RepID=UPI002FE3070B